ncbi:glyoxylate/hydroxypyruvate reductase A [Paroceanicella profunda]|uniref:Glyoxylate/hydroxypyruvate reductase A n=1 Tax=Paroceanicella profunda TaxID=2579971 RepID=A0A5B8FUB4_9RHOB|nr:glyoxylate/hydroxypyruvate reductase A [Paroceanicella profunda]QDL90680.1 glyoxylate/hydroxypyruvate reductase A [Paroceanicella profunda]
MIRALLAAPARYWPEWSPHLTHAFAAAGLEVDLVAEPDGGDFDYVIYAPGGTLSDFSTLPGVKAVFSLWAGVEKIIGNPTLTMPLTRMVDPGLVEGMVEFVTGHVLRHHLGMDAHIHGQDGVWRNDVVPPLARNRKVSVLGLGQLGGACARALAGLNFDVVGWSRRAKEIPGVACLSGDDGLEEALARAEILVLLLPLTPSTGNLLDAKRLALLPQGACIVNPGRGPLIDDDALLAALASGALGHATLDVFRQEPLPPEHPFWASKGVTVTPHIASATRPETAAQVVAENMRRAEAGALLLHLVDRAAGY